MGTNTSVSLGEARIGQASLGKGIFHFGMVLSVVLILILLFSGLSERRGRGRKNK